ncbi:MAG: tetratricopeptide repeat protein [Opitutaceae bacterium]
MNTLETTRDAVASVMYRTDDRDTDAVKNDAHYQQACDALCRGDFATAAAEAGASTTLHRHHPAAHFLAGVALLGLGLIDEAEEALLEAVSQQPVYPEAHLKLAHIYRKHRQDFFRLGEHQMLAAKAERMIRERRSSCAAA